MMYTCFSKKFRNKYSIINQFEAEPVIFITDNNTIFADNYSNINRNQE